MNVLSYYVFDGHRQWLAHDERNWTNDFHSSASFNDPKLAQDIGEREAGNRTVYVMACLGLQH